MDVSYKLDHRGHAQYFVNEYERGWCTDLFIDNEDIYPRALSVIDTLGEGLVSWVTSWKKRNIANFYDSIALRLT